MSDTIDRGRALEAQATKGPWRWGTGEPDFFDTTLVTVAMRDIGTSGVAVETCVLRLQYLCDNPSDAELIVYLRNHAQELFAASEERDRMVRIARQMRALGERELAEATEREMPAAMGVAAIRIHCAERILAVGRTPEQLERHGYGCPHDGDDLMYPKPDDCPCDAFGETPMSRAALTQTPRTA